MSDDVTAGGLTRAMKELKSESTRVVWRGKRMTINEARVLYRMHEDDKRLEVQAVLPSLKDAIDDAVAERERLKGVS